MADNTPTGVTPAETKGVNVNWRPGSDGWLLEITPNPLTVSEAFRPRWRTVFMFDGFAPNTEFTAAQMLSALSIALEEIAAEKAEPIEHWS